MSVEPMTEPAVADQINQLGALMSKGAVKEAADLLAHLRSRWRHDTRDFSAGDVSRLQQQAKAVNEALISEVDATLENTFGYSSFRPGQREIIEAAVTGQDCIGIMPTGAGKSLT